MARNDIKPTVSLFVSSPTINSKFRDHETNFPICQQKEINYIRSIVQTKRAVYSCGSPTEIISVVATSSFLNVERLRELKLYCRPKVLCGFMEIVAPN